MLPPSNLEALRQRTANAPHPRTRKEATAAFEASIVAHFWKYEGGKIVLNERPHLKKYNHAMRKGWFAFAQDERPNRGEVLVFPINREEPEWINILRVYDSFSGRFNYRTYWVNRERYPEMAERQDELLSNEVDTLEPWAYLLGVSLDEIKQKELEKWVALTPITHLPERGMYIRTFPLWSHFVFRVKWSESKVNEILSYRPLLEGYALHRLHRGIPYNMYGLRELLMEYIKNRLDNV